MKAKLTLVAMIGCFCVAGNCHAGNRNSAGLMGLQMPDSALFAANDARTADASNPYELIIDRNVFRLNPEPPPPKPEDQKPDLPVIKISGFLNIGSRRRALFAEVPKNPKDRWYYFNLGEGERDGILELLKISPDEKQAEVIESGTRMLLTVKDNGFSIAPAKGKIAPPAAIRPRSLRGFGGAPSRAIQTRSANYGAAGAPNNSATRYPGNSLRKRL